MTTTHTPTRPRCDACGCRWPCVTDHPPALLCHECRGQRTCAPCRDAAAQAENDASYDAQVNPR